MTTKPFANIDIIFCGDLYQAQLVCDSWIFEKPTITNDKIPYTFWYDNVQCFEIQTVFRQTIPQFISILKHVRISQQIDEDISYLNRKCLKPTPTNPRFPYLFQTNIAIEQHNKRILEYLSTKIHVIKSIEKDNLVANIDFQVEKSSLPNMIYLKEGALVELIRKLDTRDGLVNGVDGIFQMHMSNEEDFLWIHFTNPTIER